MLRLAGHGHDLITERAHHIHRDLAHPARRAGHHQRAGIRPLMILLKPLYAERRRKAGRAERHRLKQAHLPGQGDHPLRGDPRITRITAIMRDPEIIARHDHGIAFLKARVLRAAHMPRDINARDTREAADDPALARGRQRVLIIDRRIGGLDHHLARAECLQAEPFQPAPNPLALLPHPERLKLKHRPASDIYNARGLG